MKIMSEIKPRLSPERVGWIVRVPMQSGRMSYYKLVNAEKAHGTDWWWYDLEFISP